MAAGHRIVLDDLITGGKDVIDAQAESVRLAADGQPFF